MADKFSNIDDLTSQGRRVVAITPSDTVDLIDVPKALWVGVAGDIAGTGASGVDGVAFTYKNVPVGVFDAVRFKRIFVTGTLATNILAIY